MKYHNDVIMSAMASQITNVSIVCWKVYLGTDKKHQSSVSLVFVKGIHRWPVISPHKGPVTRKMFTFDDAIMKEWRLWSVDYDNILMVLGYSNDGAFCITDFLCGESIGDRWIHLIKHQWCGASVFYFLLVWVTWAAKNSRPYLRGRVATIFICMLHTS